MQRIDVEFKKGLTYALMGESGSGKSTLMHLLAGFDVPTEGSVCYNDLSLKDLTYSLRAQKIGFVTQTPLLITELSVYENIVLPAQIQGVAAADYQERAHTYLDAVGLLHTQQWQVGQLSGGQRQRVALVRSLITQPDFLLADEPTGNLDDKTSHELIDVLLMCQKKWDMGLVVSTHCSLVAKKMGVVFTLKNGILDRAL